jgi:hypothetical protein
MPTKKRADLLVEWIRQNCRNPFLTDISLEIRFFTVCVDRCFLFQFILEIEKTFRSWKNELKHDCALFILEFFKILIFQQKT